MVPVTKDIQSSILKVSDLEERHLREKNLMSLSSQYIMYGSIYRLINLDL